MAEILFLAHRMPFPPDRGDKIRSHHVLHRLASLTPVHMATFAEDSRDRSYEPQLAEVTESHFLADRSKPLVLAGLEALARREPVSLAAFRHAALKDYVTRTLAQRPIGAIYVFSGQMGAYVPAGFRGKLVIDFVDADSAKFADYARQKGPVRGWIDAREARLLRAEEARLAHRADASLLVSQAEADLFAAQLPPGHKGAGRVRAMPNGVDCAYFDPASTEPEPQMMACAGPRIIFTGQMDYAPNIAAAERLADGLLPAIRAVLPEATAHVVGRNPPARLAQRNGRGGFHVWGGVPDMRSWLRAADLALVPLSIGRGVQNKVLEAMAMQVPVVLSREAATGIDARDGRDFAIAQGDAALAKEALGVLADPGRAGAMGRSARTFVQDRMSWDAALEPLATLLGCGSSGALHAA